MFLCLNNNTDANLFSLCVFRMENIGGVAASRGGWRMSPNVGISINPSVTCVTAPLSLRAEEQEYTTRQQRNMSLCSYVLINYPCVYTGGRNTIASLRLLRIFIDKRTEDTKDPACVYFYRQKDRRYI